MKEDLRKRGEVEKLMWVDELVTLDAFWRETVTQTNELRERRNKLTRQVESFRRSRIDATHTISEAATIPDQIKNLEERMYDYRKRIDYILERLPNLMDSSVPIGRDDTENIEVRRWGAEPLFDFAPRDHIDLAKSLGVVDVERAAKVAGSRFYYLIGELVQLNYALIKYALDFIKERGFKLIQPPYMIKRDAMKGAVAMSDFEDTIFKVEDEDLYLIATAEHPLLAMHMDEIIDANALPLRYAGISPCFRREAGAHGRDTKGIFRTHQFEKVEQFIFCKPDDSTMEHELLISIVEEFFQSLEIPYRIVNVCSGDLGTVAAKKYDLEGWLPGQGKYRELVSCSNCTSYQAVRAKIRYRERTSEPTIFVHTLNSTLVATERTIIAIMENYQNEDGSITIPKVLIPYMGGREKISPMV